MHEKSAIWGLG